MSDRSRDAADPGTTMPDADSDGSRSPKLWYLKLNRLFRSLSDEDLHRWVDRITVAMDYPRHCVIYMAEEPGDHVYLLKRGRVRLYRLADDGRELTLAILEPGDVFGEEVLAGKARRTFAEALEPAHVCRLRGDDFVELMRGRPEVAIEALHLIAGHSMRAQEQVERVAGRSVVQRVAGLLVELAPRGARPGAPVDLAPGLTHETMASMIGTARQTFTTEVGRLVRSGYVARAGRRLRLLNVEGLRALARGDTGRIGPPGAQTEARSDEVEHLGPSEGFARATVGIGHGADRRPAAERAYRYERAATPAARPHALSA